MKFSDPMMTELCIFLIENKVRFPFPDSQNRQRVKILKDNGLVNVFPDGEVVLTQKMLEGGVL